MNQDEILAAVQRPGWRVVSAETEFEDKTEPIIVAGRDTGNTRRSTTPTGNLIWHIMGPNGEPDKVVVKAEGDGRSGGYSVVRPPAKTPSKDSTQAQIEIKDDWGGTYIYDPATKTATPVVAGSQAKYQADEAKLTEIRQKNADIEQNIANGRGYLTTEQYQKLMLDQQTGALNAETLAVRRAELEQKNIQDKRQEDRLLETARAGIGLTQAQTAGTNVETQMNEQRLKDLIAAAPDDATKRRLNNELIELQKQQAEQALKKPTIEQLGTGPTYGVMGPEGTIEERFRQGYVPKTLAEVQARTSQIDALAKQKEQEILQKYKDNPQAGYEEFQKWHAVNVQPHIAGLEAAGQEAAITRGKEIATMRTGAYTAALGAGNQVLDTFKAQAGPGFAEEYGKLLAASAGGKRPEGVDYTKMLTRPDIGPQVQQATAQALRDIDPTAAQMTGNGPPQWQNTNPADVLGMTRYMAGGTPPPAGVGAPTPLPGGSTVAIAQDPTFNRAAATSGDPWDAWRQRQAEDVLLQQRQAQIWQAHQAEQAAAQQAELDAQTGADLQALMAQQQQNDVYAYGGQPSPGPIRLPAPRARVPTPVDRSTPFVQQALAAGLGAGGLGPMGPGPQTPIYDPAAEGVPVRPIWAPGGYVPPGYQYGGQYATPSPY